MVISFLFLFTSIIGFVTLILMINSYRSNPFCNFFLVLIIGIVTFRFFIHGSYNLEFQTLLKPDRGVFSVFYLIIAPSSYLYYKYLVSQKNNYNLLDLKHLIFIVLLFIINRNETLKNSFIFYFGPITNLFFIGIFVFFYLIKNYKLLSKKIWFKKNIISNKDHFKLIKNWTIHFYIINLLCGILLLISIFAEYTIGIIPTGKSMASVLLMFWLVIFFKILLSPEILYGLPILNKTLLKFNASFLKNNDIEPYSISNNWLLETSVKKNNQDLRLQEKIKENIDSYIKEVDILSKEKYVFRNQKISQTLIAEKLGVPTSHIVYLFKYHSNITFSEYRMQSRIKDAKELIKDGFLNTETFESLAYTSGFSSYNPFFSAFKKVTKYSPQDYVKLKMVKFPIHDDKAHSLK